MDELMVQVERLPHAADLPLPAYATAGAAGVDLMAAEEVVLEAGAHAAVRTGLRLALPDGCEAQVRPRSGLALRHAVTVLNAPGTIDADYRGEVQVLLINHGRSAFRVERGMRIAQLVFAPVATARWQEVTVSERGTPRGDGAFGSTGLGIAIASRADEGQAC
jgi:dUTP pyrophosphatase